MPLRRPWHRQRRRPTFTLERQPDALPMVGLFTEPVRVVRLDPLDHEPTEDGRSRVTFLVEVKDADDKRCSNVAVEAHVAGPDRSGTVQGATDMLGRIRFQMIGPPGPFAVEITDVAAGGLAWDRDAGPTTARVDVPT